MRKKRIRKAIEGTVITFTFSDETSVSFDTLELPEEIQKSLVPFGLGHKLGDSAAGISDLEEIKETIQSTWSALKEGRWTIRTSTEKRERNRKRFVSEIVSKLQTLPEDQQEMAKKLLTNLGLNF